MSIFDKQPAPLSAPVGSTTPASSEKPAWSAPWSSVGFARGTPADEAPGADRPWWQSLAEASYLKPLATAQPTNISMPTSAPALTSLPAPTNEAGPVSEEEPVSEAASMSEAEPVSEAALMSEAEPVSEAALTSEAEPTSEDALMSEAEPTSESTTSGEVDAAVAEAARNQRAAEKAAAMAKRGFDHIEDFDAFLVGTTPEELALIKKAYQDLVPHEPGADPFTERFAPYLKDHERWERMAKVDQEKVSEAVVAIFNSCDQLGTDEDTIMKQLRGKTPDELKEMERVFQATYPGKSLAGIISAEMEGDYFAEANALLGGDNITAAAYGLENALWGVGADSAKIEEVLRSIPADQRANVLSTYKAMFGQSFDTSLEGESFLGYSEVDGFKELGAGNDAKADAHLIQYELGGGLFGMDDEGRQHVEAMLEGSSDPAAIAKAYASIHRGQTTLDAALDEGLAGPDRDVASALMDPAVNEEAKRAKVAAARIMRGLDEGKLDKGKVLEELTKTEGADRERLVAELAQNPDYKALIDGAQSRKPEELTDLDRFVIAFDDINKPGTSDADVFTAALQGDMDEGSIEAAKRALAGMTKDQIDGRKDLVEKLKAAVSGSARDEFEVEQLVQYGKPEGTPEEQLLQLREREEAAYHHERAGGSWFIDAFSDAGEHLDERHKRSQARYDRLTEDGDVDEAEVSELERDLEYTNSARSSYATRKDEIADTTASVIGAAALAGGTLLTGGALAAWLPMIENAAVLANAGGAAISGGASMFTKHLLKDNTYNSDERWKDAAMTTVGMGTAALSQTQGLTNLVTKSKYLSSSPLLVAGAKGALTGVAAGAGQGAVNSLATGEIDPKAIAVGMIGQAVGGAAGNMVGGAIENPWLAKVTEKFPAGSKDYLWKALPVKAAAGAIGGAVGGGLQAGADPGTYDGDTGSFLTKVGIGGLGGALGNVAQGLAEGFGDHAKAENATAKASQQAAAPTPTTAPLAATAAPPAATAELGGDDPFAWLRDLQEGNAD